MNVLTVSQLNRYLSYKLKEDSKLKGIYLKGEISNFKNAGHLYFTLKDSDSLVKAVMFKSSAAGLKFIPENGQSVIAMGSVQVFERDGVYQLYVTDMVPDGAGSVQAEFEKLKKEFAAEGIFDPAHKKKLPAFPERVGVITSEKGAALQDMINIMSRRYPVAQMYLYPSLVQGADAPASLCRALSIADCDDCDVIIIGRGGGSSEDLSAFRRFPERTHTFLCYSCLFCSYSCIYQRKKICCSFQRSKCKRKHCKGFGCKSSVLKELCI